MRSTHRGLTAAGLAALLVLTACSGGDDPAETSGTSDTAVTTPDTDSGDTTSPAPPTDDTSEDAQATTTDPTESTSDATESPVLDDPAFGDYGVAAGHPLAVDAGMEMLDSGGNAVDAAVAVAFSMAVIEPLTSGPGGGGAALVVPMPGSTAPGNPPAPVAYDYREVVQSSGGISAGGTGIPGFVAGTALLHAEHGRLPWDRVLEPAIRQAEDGVPVSWFVAQELRTDAGVAATRDLSQFASDDGEPLAEGDLLVQPELAQTLRDLATDPGTFYDGALAEDLVDIEGIDAQGLETYQVDTREPPRGPVGDYELLTAAPGLSGVALIQLLQVAEAGGLADTEPGSPAYFDTLADSWQVADNSIETVLGDPNFIDVPVAELTDPEANAALAESRSVGVAGPALPDDDLPDVDLPDVDVSDAGLAAARPAPGNTTHLSVVDGDGLSVSMTNTITSFWGSGQEVGGFFINDHLIRFATGRTAANRPEAGRRPLSFMTPAVLLDDQQRPVLVIGSPGGRRIPNIQAGVISRWALLDQDLQTSVDAPRAHLEGNLLRVEELPAETIDELTDLGYDVTPVPLSWSLFGSVQVLELDHGSGELIGAVDSRRTGAWASRTEQD